MLCLTASQEQHDALCWQVNRKKPGRGAHATKTSTAPSSAAGRSRRFNSSSFTASAFAYGGGRPVAALATSRFAMRSLSL